MKKCPLLYLVILLLLADAFFPGLGFSRQMTESAGIPLPGIVDKQGNPLLSGEGLLWFSDHATGEVLWQRTWEEEAPPALAVISPDGRWLVLSSAGEEKVYIHDLEHTDKPPRSMSVGLIDMRFSPGSDRAYLLHSKTLWNATLSHYTLPDWELSAERKVSDYTTELALSREGSRLLMATRNKLIKSLDPVSLKTLQVDWETEGLAEMVFHPSTADVYAGITPGNGVEVRDLERRESLLTISPLVHPVTGVDFTTNGDYLLCRDTEGNLIIWDLKHPEKSYLLPQVLLAKDDLRLDGKASRLEDTYSRIQTEEDIWGLGGVPLDASHPLFRTDTEKRHRIAPLPIIGYSAETNFFLGLTLDIVLDRKKETSTTSRFSRPSTIMPTVFYGFSGILSTGIKTEFFHNDQWYFYNNIAYVSNSLSVYYGVNSLPERLDQTRFRNKLFNWQGMVSRQVSSDWFAGLKYEIRHDSPLILSGEGVSPIPDMEGGFVAGIGPVIKWDTRNDIFFPRIGHSLEISYVHFGDWIGTDYSFNSFILDYRHYVPLSMSTPGSVLAFQLLYHHVDGGNTPFYMMPYLGGDRLIRGSWRNLYLDRQATLLQTELRSDFSSIDPRYGYVVFAGIGDVAEDFFSGYNPSLIGVGGVGFRQQLIPKLKLQSRIDFTLSTRGEWGIYGGIGVSF